jgi:hypothetical protein
MEGSSQGDPMDRGLSAPLSPNEEVTLRRVALGITGRGELRAANLARLIDLLLVEEIDGRLALSDLGWQRYQLLPKAPDIGNVAGSGELTAALKRIPRTDKR